MNVIRYSICALLFVLASPNLPAQDWQFVTTQHHAGVSDSRGTALVAGWYGYVLRTTDYGETWSLPQTGTYKHIYALYLGDDGAAWGVGDSGLALYSGDNGATWSRRDAPTGERLRFLTRSSGLLHAVGDSTIFQFDQGGWKIAGKITPFTLLKEGPNSEIWALDSAGRLYRSTDILSTWDAVMVDNPVGTLWQGLDVKGSTIALGGPEGRWALSFDGGENWRTGNVGNTDFNATYPLIRDDNILFGGESLDDLAFPIYSTSDSGTSFEESVLRQFRSRLMAATTIFPIAADTLVLGTSNGSLYRISGDGPLVDTINDPHFNLQGYTGMASVSLHENFGLSPGRSFISSYLRTLDTGITWQTRAVHGIDHLQSKVFDDGRAFLLETDLRLSVTYSYAEQWAIRKKEHDTPFGRITAFDVSFLDSLTWRALITGNVGSYLLKTEDGGRTYSTTLLDSVKFPGDVSFISPDRGIVSVVYSYSSTGTPNGSVLHTTDGGNSWRAIYIDAVPGFIRLLTPDHIVIGVSGPAIDSEAQYVLMETRNGGNTWTTLYESNEIIWDLLIVTDDLWYAVGRNALIMRSTNGGSTWERHSFDHTPTTFLALTPRVPDFTHISISDDQRFLFIGGTNAMLRAQLPRELLDVPPSSPSSGEQVPLSIGVTADASAALISLPASLAERALSLVISDLQGRIVKQYILQPRRGQVRLETSGYPSGIYLLEAQDGESGSHASGRFVIVR